MIVKMTQSPENEMELQINRLEAKIEKMQGPRRSKEDSVNNEQ